MLRRFPLFVTVGELIELHDAARREGVTVSVFVRDAALGRARRRPAVRPLGRARLMLEPAGESEHEVIRARRTGSDSGPR